MDLPTARRRKARGGSEYAVTAVADDIPTAPSQQPECDAYVPGAAESRMLVLGTHVLPSQHP